MMITMPVAHHALVPDLGPEIVPIYRPHTRMKLSETYFAWIYLPDARQAELILWIPGRHDYPDVWLDCSALQQTIEITDLERELMTNATLPGVDGGEHGTV